MPLFLKKMLLLLFLSFKASTHHSAAAVPPWDVQVRTINTCNWRKDLKYLEWLSCFLIKFVELKPPSEPFWMLIVRLRRRKRKVFYLGLNLLNTSLSHIWVPRFSNELLQGFLPSVSHETQQVEPLTFCQEHYVHLRFSSVTASIFIVHESRGESNPLDGGFCSALCWFCINDPREPRLLKVLWVFFFYLGGGRLHVSEVKRIPSSYVL